MADRGYRDGWTMEQYAYRQLLKMAEELGELRACFNVANSNGQPFRLLAVDHIAETGGLCRMAFDYMPADIEVVVDTTEATAEAADVQVTLLTLAEALAELAGAPFDVIEAAKATTDVKRGIRR